MPPLSRFAAAKLAAVSPGARRPYWLVRVAIAAADGIPLAQKSATASVYRTSYRLELTTAADGEIFEPSTVASTAEEAKYGLATGSVMSNPGNGMTVAPRLVNSPTSRLKTSRCPAPYVSCGLTPVAIRPLTFIQSVCGMPTVTPDSGLRPGRGR